MKQCQQCNLEKPLDQFKRSGPLKTVMRFCLDCYTSNRRRSKSGERPYDPRNHGLLAGYGITSADYDRMAEEQGNRCAICLSEDRKSPKRVKHWYVDHCHTTGKVRGLLCNACNRAIGNLGDDISNFERAILYLKKHD